VCKQGELRWWDGSSGRALGEPVVAHLGPITSLAFSADGKMLASGGSDNSVILWDAALRQAIGPPMAEHTAPVAAIAFDADGSLHTVTHSGWTISYETNPAAWITNACTIANRRLTPEWNRFLGEETQYEPACSSPAERSGKKAGK
jgi:WD40 repeat protein